METGYKKTDPKLWKAACFFAKGALDDASIEDAIGEAYEELLKRRDSIKYPGTYLNRIIERKIYDLLRKRAKEKTDQFDDLAPANPESGISTQRRHALNSPNKSFLEVLMQQWPEKYETLKECLNYIGLLYSLKANLDAAQRSVIPISKSINALKEAKDKIDELGRPLSRGVIKKLDREYIKINPRPAGSPSPSLPENPVQATAILRRRYESIRPYPEELRKFNRDYFFYEKEGASISGRLEREIKALKLARNNELTGPGTSPEDQAEWLIRIDERGEAQFLDIQLSDFVLDSISKLRADPIMLVLRVLYKMFKIGSGKYGARKGIRGLILELKTKYRDSKWDYRLFRTVSAKTDFETLRKKIYKKTADPFYDRLADEIYSSCSARTAFRLPEPS